jgi:hypothetical protein
LHPLARGGMGDTESPSVEHEALGVASLAGGLAVDGVAEKRVAEETVVNADLVSAPSVKSAKDERSAILCSVEEMKVGDGRLS